MTPAYDNAITPAPDALTFTPNSRQSSTALRPARDRPAMTTEWTFIQFGNRQIDGWQARVTCDGAQGERRVIEATGVVAESSRREHRLHPRPRFVALRTPSHAT